jgi:hypothetical protein
MAPRTRLRFVEIAAALAEHFPRWSRPVERRSIWPINASVAAEGSGRHRLLGFGADDGTLGDTSSPSRVGEGEVRARAGVGGSSRLICSKTTDS